MRSQKSNRKVARLCSERFFQSTNETEWLTGDGPMRNEDSYVALGLKTWNAQIDRADKLFGRLSSEEILREIAPGRKQASLLMGTSHSRTRRDAPAIVAGRTTSSRV